LAIDGAGSVDEHERRAGEERREAVVTAAGAQAARPRQIVGEPAAHEIGNAGQQKRQRREQPPASSEKPICLIKYVGTSAAT
jgi:hypothetical protein